MPEGGAVTVATFRKRAVRPSDGNEDEYAGLYVRDEGIGISKQDQERLFEPFFTTKSDREGSGLGLSVCRGIVQSHGGWITVESEPGKGARFTAYFPAKGEA
jgi:signal transduction histidine kinase